MRRRYYEPEGRRLVYVTGSADPEFWDAQWSDSVHETLYEHIPRRSLVVRETRRFVPAGGLVLEGGCGLARNSWYLRESGYSTIALDYVPRALIEVRRRIPQVRPVRGDVRALPLADDEVDAYWSIGVIEHWYGGYREARDEMARVLRPGGHLFLTFPYMNPLRKLRARLGTYARWSREAVGLDSFYQFALDPRQVTEAFESVGFVLVDTTPFLGVTGLEEDLPAVLARWVARTQGTGFLRRTLRALLAMTSQSWASHCVLLVLRKGDVTTPSLSPSSR